jgi:hypothetical protein
MTIVLNGTTGLTAPGTETFGDGTALGGATNPIVSMAKGANNYVQGYIVNNTDAVNASADLVCYPSNGTDSSGWIDMGITGPTFSQVAYGITGPNEGYIFMSAPSGASKTGNLVLATDSTGTQNAIKFATGGFGSTTERMRLDQAGNLGLGVTPSAWAGGYKSYDVQGASFASSGSAGILILGNNAYNNGTNWIYKANGYATDYVQINSEHRWRIAASGTAGGTISYTQAMTLDASGNLTVPAIYTNTTASVSYVAVSSAGLLQRGGVSALKYKQDIRDLESIDINKFRSVRYKSKCENDDQTKDHFGFIADEVAEQGLTELVTYGEDGDIEGFQYERMCVVLLKNAQEQQAIITDMAAKLKSAGVTGF